MSSTDFDMEDIVSVSESSENENIERFLTFISDNINFSSSMFFGLFINNKSNSLSVNI